MVQDTRKDPRAKVLSMTVRYRSATVDEFIEHHSHDISRGGMFIKTPSPFPPGTLLKFEVRIAEEQKLMQGVGRVVWKRDPSSSSSDMPTGMGVKFIKIDEESKRIIDRLVAQRGNGESAFEQGQREETPRSPAAATPSPQPGTGMLAQAAAAAAAAGGAADVPRPVRKGTVIGLGAMHPPPELQAAAQQASEPFFPKGEPAEQPAPEDRTVMKQAAELLQEALREAGGSLDEVMGADAKAEQPAPMGDQGETPAQEPYGKTPSNGAAEAARAPTEQLPAADAPTVKMETVPTKSEREPEAFREREPARPAVAEAPMPEQKGSMSAVWMLLGVVVIGGGIYFFTQQRKPPPEEALPAPVAQPAPPKPVAAPKPVEPKPDEAAMKAAEEARKAEEAAKAAEAAKAEEEAKKAAEEEAKKAEEEAKKAAAKAAAPRPRRPRPKPVATEETETGSTAAPAETGAPTATAAPTTAPTGATPKPESTGAPKTSPSPTPTPTSGPDKLY